MLTWVIGGYLRLRVKGVLSRLGEADRFNTGSLPVQAENDEGQGPEAPQARPPLG